MKTAAINRYVIALLVTCWSFGLGQDPVAPDIKVDYLPLSIYPSKWREVGQDASLWPWFGHRVVLLTEGVDYDHKKMGQFLHQLDRAFAFHSDLVPGYRPIDNWHLRNRTIVAAIPDLEPSLMMEDCLWCARSGAQGMETVIFDLDHWPAYCEDPKQFSLDYLEGLALQHYPFGRKHAAFDYGFARLLGMLALEEFQLKDHLPSRPAHIRDMEAVYREEAVDFKKALMSPLGHRLKRSYGGREIIESGPESIYASIMLKLAAEHGGKDFVRRFVRGMAKLPDVREGEWKDARIMARTWAAGIQLAAGRDLNERLIKHWKFPLTKDDLSWIQNAVASAKAEPQKAPAAPRDSSGSAEGIRLHHR